jgi:hypothetical protein
MARGMRHLVVGTAFIAVIVAGRAEGRDAKQGRPVVVVEESAIIVDGKKVQYPLRFYCFGPASRDHAYEIGERVVVMIGLENEGDQTIYLPLPYRLPSPVPVDVKMSDEEGVAQWGDSPNPEATCVNLIPLQPGQSLDCIRTVVPWNDGVFDYQVIVENQIATRWVAGGRIVDRTGKVVGYGSGPSGIPNVWVGRVRVTGRMTVRDADPAAEKLSPHFQELFRQIKRLEEVVLSKDAMLLDRIAAVDKIAGMRHLYAASSLIKLEQHLRESRAVHASIIRALYELTLNGMGYLGLPVYVEVARSPEVSVPDRLLCVELLRIFASQEAIMHGAKAIHIIMEDERSKARRVLRDLANLPGGAADEVRIAAMEALPAQRLVQGMDAGNPVIDGGIGASEPVQGRSPASDGGNEGED